MKIKKYIDYKYASKIYNEILTNSKTTNGIEYYYKPKYINSNILKYLNEKYSSHQVILFTCTQREKNILNKENIECNVISL